MRSSAGYSLVAIIAFALGIIFDFRDAPPHVISIFVLAGVANSCTAAILRALGK